MCILFHIFVTPHQHTLFLLVIIHHTYALFFAPFFSSLFFLPFFLPPCPSLFFLTFAFWRKPTSTSGVPFTPARCNALPLQSLEVFLPSSSIQNTKITQIKAPTRSTTTKTPKYSALQALHLWAFPHLGLGLSLWRGTELFNAFAGSLALNRGECGCPQQFFCELTAGLMRRPI